MNGCENIQKFRIFKRGKVTSEIGVNEVADARI